MLIDFQQEISQDWYSGDVIRALELSGSLVPQVLKQISRINFILKTFPPQNLREMFEGFKLRMAQVSCYSSLIKKKANSGTSYTRAPYFLLIRYANVA